MPICALNLATFVALNLATFLALNLASFVALFLASFVALFGAPLRSYFDPPFGEQWWPTLSLEPPIPGLWLSPLSLAGSPGSPIAFLSLAAPRP